MRAPVIRVALRVHGVSVMHYLSRSKRPVADPIQRIEGERVKGPHFRIGGQDAN